MTSTDLPRTTQRNTMASKTFAIVGSRAATSYGERVAADIAHDLALAGHTIVSGGAFGIDAAAHRGALTAGGRTIAVLPCGKDIAHPHAHRDLFEHIAKSGGQLVSSFPDGAAPTRERIKERDRHIAKLAVDGVIVVEASSRSGALYTAHQARDLGRAVFAVPGPVTSTVSNGTHQLIRDGATLIEDAADVLACSQTATPTAEGDNERHDRLQWS